MSELDKLINADAENVVASRKNLGSFDIALSAALDDVANMYDEFLGLLKGVPAERSYSDRLEECAVELGVSAEELGPMLMSDNSSDKALEPARDAMNTMLARRGLEILLLLTQRHYMWAAADLLRMRLTSASANVRMQIEAAGLLNLALKRSDLVLSWMHVCTSDEGREFFNKTQSELKKELKELRLLDAYERASASSMHVRPASAVRGLDLRPGEGFALGLQYQEWNPERPFAYFNWVVCFVRTQEGVLTALGKAFPEVDQTTWSGQVAKLTATVNSLYARLEKRFPNEWKEAAQDPHARRS